MPDLLQEFEQRIQKAERDSYLAAIREIDNNVKSEQERNLLLMKVAMTMINSASISLWSSLMGEQLTQKQGS